MKLNTNFTHYACKDPINYILFSIELNKIINIKNNFMKTSNSLKTLKMRHKDNYIVRRKKRIYIYNKTNSKFKIRQG